MPGLVLGPILRHADATTATVWVETDGPCDVTVLGTSARTFCVGSRHYGLVPLTGLTPGESVPYTVALDGRTVWPEPGSALPPSLIRTVAPGDDVRLVFGSCRVSLPHEPPWTLDASEHPEAHGIDALRAYALRMRDRPAAEWPNLLLLLGDQVYADDLSHRMREITRSRRHAADVPSGELEDFEDYALAYGEAWSEPLVRWLLSTVPTAMILDDHEVHAQWRISAAWMESMRAKPWFDDHIAAALSAYWIYQHLGNLSPSELSRNELYRRTQAAGDASGLLHAEMAEAGRQPGHSRWSYCRDLGRSRLVVIDSRAGRRLDRGRRRMIDDAEWRWITEQATGDFEHVLLASSVPFFLTPGLHHVEAWDEALADGAWGARAAGVAERLRQSGVMDHWAAFQHSFHDATQLLAELARGERGRPPASIVMLSGDVHHCYLAEIGFRRNSGTQSAVWQAVCSAYRKQLARREKLAMRFANGPVGRRAAHLLARAAGVDPPTELDWRILDGPRYENQVGSLTLTGRRAHLRVETTAGADWRAPRLRTLFERELTPPPGPTPRGTS